MTRIQARLICAVLMVLFSASMSVLGCRSRCPIDVDETHAKALRIWPAIDIPDSIDAKCDPVDWKSFSYPQDVKVQVTISFGDLFKAHSVEGEIGLYSFEGNLLDRRPVVPQTRVYEFTFTAQKEKSYYFKISAKKGASAYVLRAETSPIDPCASCPPERCCKEAGVCCEPGTVCKGKECVRADVCEPQCAPGSVCVMGRCEEVCPGGCGRGYYCDQGKRACVPTSPRQRQVTPEKPKVETPLKCPAGRSYNPKTGTCEGGGGNIVGKVIEATQTGKGVVVNINRGSDHGVRKGQTATVGGYQFTIGTVSATRCKATIPNASADELKGKTVTIFGD
jgi:hypothetical protein